MVYVASGKAFNPVTRQHDQPVSVEFPNKAQADNWRKFNRDWMTDLKVEPKP